MTRTLPTRDASPTPAPLHWRKRILRPRLKRLAFWHDWAWLAIPLFGMGLVITSAFEFNAVWNPSYSLGLLNTFFLAVIPALGLVLAWRAFVADGAWSLLLMGCGLLAFGFGGLTVGWYVRGPETWNLVVTIYNIAAFLAGGFHLASALLATRGAMRGSAAGRLRLVGIMATLLLGLMVLLSLAAAMGWLPPFLIPGQGSQPIRHVVLGMAVLSFAWAGVRFGLLGATLKRNFFRWYSMALLLTAMGLLGVLLPSPVGGPTGWIGRVAQFAGSVYLLIALMVLSRHALSRRLSPSRDLALSFRQAQVNDKHKAHAAHHAVIWLDPTWLVLSWNPAAEMLLGWSAEEAMGRELGSLLASGQDPTAVPPCLLPQAPDGMMEANLRSHSGREFPADITRLRGQGPQADLTILAIHDITARHQEDIALRRRQEELDELVAHRTAALRESEERFRTMADGSPLMIWVSNTHGRLEFVNHAYQDFFGWPRQEQPPLVDWQTLVHPQDASAYHSAFLEAGQKQQAFHAQVRVRRHDGQWRWIESYAQPRFDGQGRYVGMVGSSPDITQRIQTQEALLRQAHRLEILTQTASTLLESRQPQQLIDALCRRVMEHLDCQVFINFLLEPAGGMLRLNACAGVPDERLPEMQLLEPGQVVSGGVVREGRPIVCEQIDRGDDPRMALVRSLGVKAYCCHPLNGPAGRILGTLAFGATQREKFSDEDVSLMKAVANQVSIALVRLEQEEALRDLNVNLENRVIHRTAQVRDQAGKLRLLASELTRTEDRERRRLAQILHDHLQQFMVAAKMRVGLAGTQPLAACRQTLKEVEELLRQSLETSRELTAELSPPILYDSGLVAALAWLSRWVEEKHGLSVEVHTPVEAEPAEEDVRVFLFGAARELIFNIAKHARVDRASISLLRHGSDQVRLIVEDQGQGFDPQAMQSCTSGGYGLASIRERLHVMGGTIDIQSVPGDGTRVTLTLPTHEVAAATKSGGDAIPDAVAVSRQPQRPLRVLLVDDHVVVRGGLKMLLAAADIEVVGEAGDGLQALEAVRNLQPDVVLMDVSMPRMDGVEATRRLCAEWLGIKIVGLSMYQDADMASAMRRAGAVAFLSKDAPGDKLIHAIRQCRS